MSNSNKVNIYYAPSNDPNNEDYRLSPSPMISMSTEFNYGNDNIIGYNNIINLNGYITNYIEADDTDPDYGKRLFGKNLERINKFKELLSQNGHSLSIYNKNENSETFELILKAKGGILRSLTFDKSDNFWTSNVKYTASLEFNEIEFIGETISCIGGEIDTTNYITNLVNPAEYKIKSFSDSWNFVVNDDSFNYHDKIDNTRIQVSYNVSAVGKHYYDDDGKTLPAHEQARKFVQKMLYDRVASFTSTDIFDITGSGACGSGLLNDIHQHDSSGIVGGLSNFLRYNDSLNIQVSESEGSVSASFSCLFKRSYLIYTGRFDSANTIHNVTSSIRKNTTGGKTQTTINVQGNIQGLTEGGIIEPENLGQFTLPSQTGNFLIQAQGASNIKYNNASACYFGVIGNEDDLKDEFKTYLGISLSSLNIQSTGCGLNDDNTQIRPVSFNLTKNYNEGTISYSVDYDSNVVCKDNNQNNKDVTSISISKEIGSPVLAEFIIPFAGMVVQDIGTKTNTKINISVNGSKVKTTGSGNRICCNTIDQILSDISGLIGECGANSNLGLPSGITVPEDSIIISKQKSEDKVTGNYSINITYICSSGCEIV